MATEVILRVQPEVAQVLHHGQSPTNQSAELLRVVQELGLSLQPIHPGIDDAELMRYFALQVPNSALGEEVSRRLRQCSAIDAAYVKPQAEPP